MNLYIHNAPDMSEDELKNLSEKLSIFAQRQIDKGIKDKSMKNLLQAFTAREFSNRPGLTIDGNQQKGDIAYDMLSGRFVDPVRAPPKIEDNSCREEVKRAVYAQLQADHEKRIHRV
jgi:hypothetical protein